MTLRYAGLTAALVWMGLVTLGLVHFAEPMKPVRDGTPTALWQAVAGIGSTGEAGLFGPPAFVVDEPVCYYQSVHLHGSDVYAVDLAAVEPSLPAVVVALERGGGYAFARDALDAWRVEPSYSQTVDRFLQLIRDAHVASLEPERATYLGVEEFVLQERVYRARWLWATFAFEWIWLSGLGCLLLLPLVRGGDIRRWALCFALAPLLFMLPVYLGYATYTFTSRGPSGGVLYPMLLASVRGWGMTDFEAALLSHVPPVLECMSPGIGIPAAISGAGMPGPSRVLVAMLGAAAIGAVFAISLQRWRGREPRLTQATGEAEAVG